MAEDKKSQTASGESPDLSLTRMGPAHQKPLFRPSWSQYVFLVGIKDDQERSFYEIEAATNGWTLPELKRQFASSLYERLALGRDKTSLDILWLRDKSLADLDNLPDPDELANDIIENLEAAVESFKEITQRI